MDRNNEINGLANNNNIHEIDFHGLSPKQMHHLLYYPYSEEAPIKIKMIINDSVLDKIPLFCIAEEYLKILQREKAIKLTKTGALPKKVLTEVYDKKILPVWMIEDGFSKLTREHDFISLMSVRHILQNERLVKKINGILSLTKKGLDLIKCENRKKLFNVFFEAFTEKFFWGFNDAASSEYIGQFGWMYTIISLDKYGSEFRDGDFYYDKYSETFPSFIKYVKNNSIEFFEGSYANCYRVRVFDRFLVWFGLVSVVDAPNPKGLGKINKYKPTEIFYQVFDFSHI